MTEAELRENQNAKYDSSGLLLANHSHMTFLSRWNAAVRQCSVSIDWLMLRIATIATTVMLFTCLGCGSSGDSANSASSFEPDGVALAAMKTYDTNSDGKIDKKELAKSLALQSALPRIDANRDGAIDQQEVAARLSTYSSPATGVRPEVFVMRGGKPAQGVTVAFEPEEFMGQDLQSYQATVSDWGSAALQGTNDSSYQLTSGFYRVRITSPEGTEQIEGCEVAADVPNITRMTFNLR